MKHLTVGIFALSILTLSIHYKVIKIDTTIIHKNVWNIVVWIVSLTLGVIISSWLK
ncbi:hypothetical protein [Clostridium brassicae]|uniref:Uncharacterized protein n=1 Tax=Clostridium brassicae TaxID=2999072 RepID=A0ABT4D9B2_9CLOT|nr:hypothetical protein [Clostridium brassicae]MCY6958903.1 hypothetical protein [Clostridium brassicae]